MSITNKGAAAGTAAGTKELPKIFYIQRMQPRGFVLDVYQNNPASNQQVIAYAPHGGTNQQWEFVPAESPGWWYLRTRMGTGFVATLDVSSRNIVMAQPAGGSRDEQLWCLVPTSAPGYWFIQSKLDVSNSVDANVIGITNNASTPDAVAVSLDYKGFENQAWAFAPMYEP
ncbi:RICIN domain-containing protein [Variovorax sp. Root411]|uniref:RICIN domain-containing protein n=1 Tax=Variovorax sp. Root411 TaxID=1736530 RepID=UPI00070144AC|nr:RICIN domain-containing protein [Variovorax sp. Root411]KQW60970.1 hypothetical protein ASC92_27205 [Variovorax sp. Root411]